MQLISSACDVVDPSRSPDLRAIRNEDSTAIRLSRAERRTSRNADRDRRRRNKAAAGEPHGGGRGPSRANSMITEDRFAASVTDCH